MTLANSRDLSLEFHIELSLRGVARLAKKLEIALAVLAAKNEWNDVIEPRGKVRANDTLTVLALILCLARDPVSNSRRDCRVVRSAVPFRNASHIFIAR